MGLTREEYNTIQEIVKRIRKLERRLDSLESLVESMELILDKLDAQVTMEDWSDQQWRDFLAPYISEALKNISTKPHNHTNIQQGGEAFAKLGANLIE